MSTPTKHRPFCRFYTLHGSCRNGDHCHFSHEFGDLSRDEALKTIPCIYFQKGCCRYGDACQFSHGDCRVGGIGGSPLVCGSVDATEGSGGLSSPFRAGISESGYGMEQSSFAGFDNSNYDTTTSYTSPSHAQQQHQIESTTDNMNTNALEEEEEEVLCGICLENPLSSQNPRQFGLLSCCSHTFCYQCLMEWRTEGSTEVTSRRVCPTCRKPSDYVVPSPVLARDEDEKNLILRNYKERLATIPCKYFDGVLGSCSFGRDCFYAHLDDEGKDVKGRDKSSKELYERRQRNRSRRGNNRDVELDMMIMMGIWRHIHGMANGDRGERNRGEDSDEDEEDIGGLMSFFQDFLLSDLDDSS